MMKIPINDSAVLVIHDDGHCSANSKTCIDMIKEQAEINDKHTAPEIILEETPLM